MAENRKKILEMVAENKIGIDEAVRLLELVEEPVVSSESKKSPKYLRITVRPSTECGGDTDVERVNIRVPLALIRAGVKLTSLVPDEVADKVDTAMKEKGINFKLRKIKWSRKNYWIHAEMQ